MVLFGYCPDYLFSLAIGIVWGKETIIASLSLLMPSISAKSFNK
jgi:hypothetical protein